MAIVGLKLVKLALVDPKTQKLIKSPEGLSTDGVIEIDSKMLGTRTANISNLEGQATKVPGNNEVQDIMIAPGSPTVAFEFNNLDFDIKQKILGFKSDKKGGYVYQGEKPHVAVLIESQTLDRKNSVYFGFANGIFQESTQNVATDTDTAQTRQNDHLTYNALSATAFGGEPIKKYFTGSSTFDKANMYKEVFGGYTLGKQGPKGDRGNDGKTTNFHTALNLIVNSSAKTKDGFFKNFDKVENGYGEVTFTGTNTWVSRDMWDGFSIKPRDYKPGDKYTMSMDVMFTSWNLPAGTHLDEFWIGQRYGAPSWKRICFIDLPKDPSKMLNQWVRITQTSTIPPYEDPAINTEAWFLTKFTGPSEGSFTVRIRNPKQVPGEERGD